MCYCYAVTTHYTPPKKMFIYSTNYLIFKFLNICESKKVAPERQQRSSLCALCLYAEKKKFQTIFAIDWVLPKKRLIELIKSANPANICWTKLFVFFFVGEKKLKLHDSNYLHCARLGLYVNTGLPKFLWIWFKNNTKTIWWLHRIDADDLVVRLVVNIWNEK